jgi:hypothetical protein
MTLRLAIFKVEEIMNFHLVVLKPFDGHKRGDVITDTPTVQKILAGPQAGFVVRVRAKGV